MDPSSRLLFLGAGGPVVAPPGQQEYISPGTYSWVAPAGVNSVSVVVVGGGGAGASAHDSNGGGGGSLGWKNNIPVTPGASYTVVVGQGATAPAAGTNVAGTAGGQSYFINTSTVQANGGAGGPGDDLGPTSNAGGFVGDGGGGGGYGTSTRGGGCGAGGYTGTGGLAATTNQSPTPPTAFSGAGSAGVNMDNVMPAAGGGVGIYGKGADGVSPTYNASWSNGAWTFSQSLANDFMTAQGGKGGSGGGNAFAVFNVAAGPSYPFSTDGGAPGGGGGGAFFGSGTQGGNGAHGAVRIIWGVNRSFPSTNTANV